MEEKFQEAARIIADSDAIMIGAGAGMGVDSGLPDFRGNEGFWRAYPPFRRLGLSFVDLANPVWFERDPHRAWGFYGHRTHLYRQTRPHRGFLKLLSWCQQKADNYFVFTSNVDGHFQQSGFDSRRVFECHGSIGHLQCNHASCQHIWKNDVELVVDESTMLARDPLPECHQCEQVARPNILMFNDWDWICDRSDQQNRRYLEWLREIENQSVAILEFGAGTHVPSVRYECERMKHPLIRVNPREPNVPDPNSISVPCGALEAIQGINEYLE